MTEREALEILRAHNEWRRWSSDDLLELALEQTGPTMGDPKEIGEAIDVACRVLEERTA